MIRSELHWYVYILECADNTLYTGITNNLQKRLDQHNRGKAASYTRGRIPVTLNYFERVNNRGDALRREWKIKNMTRAMKLDMIRKFEYSLN